MTPEQVTEAATLLSRREALKSAIEVVHPKYEQRSAQDRNGGLSWMGQHLDGILIDKADMLGILKDRLKLVEQALNNLGVNL